MYAILSSYLFCDCACAGIIRVFLACDNFCVREKIIFEKCVEWARNQELTQKHKQDNSNSSNNGDSNGNDVGYYFNLVKHFIRFPIMEKEYFDQQVIDSGLLTSGECLDILRYIDFNHQNAQIKNKVEKTYNCNKRDVLLDFGELMDVTSDEFSQLVQFLPQQSQQSEWKLLFCASEHNFSAGEFHRCCDNKESPTVVIVKVDGSGDIFGGYTEAKWDSSYQYKADPNAFVFYLRRNNAINNSNSIPAKFPMIHANGANAVYCRPENGPTFGDANHILISNSCNVNNTSHFYCYTGCFNTQSIGQRNQIIQCKIKEYQVWQLVQ